MSFNAMPDRPDSAILLDDRLYLDIPVESLQSTLLQSASLQSSAQTGSLTAGGQWAGAQWRAALNQLCLVALLPWLQQVQAMEPRVWSRSTLASIWSVVNGTAIDCGQQRWIVLPTVEIDQAELSVPQEWVDIPSWAGDYYLGVQVNLSEGVVSLWGYATHAQLKTEAVYDAADRVYRLSQESSGRNVNLIPLAQHFCPARVTRTAIDPIPALSRTQLAGFIDRLSPASIAFPRLALPFQRWAGLMQSEGWRQRFYEQRQGLRQQRSVPQWLQQGISEVGAQLSQQLDGGQLNRWQLSRWQFASGMRSRVEEPLQGLRRSVSIANQNYELRLFPRVESGQQHLPAQQIWRFELRHATGAMIPAGYKLRLLTSELQPFENNEDTAIEGTTQLYIEVVIEPGEEIIWEIEPTPDDYVQEILSF